MVSSIIILIKNYGVYFFQTSFSTLHGTRDDVPHIIVHITDSPSANPGLLLQEAENAHNQGITIFNIGVGEGVEPDHLAKVLFVFVFSCREQLQSYSEKKKKRKKI